MSVTRLVLPLQVSGRSHSIVCNYMGCASSAKFVPHDDIPGRDAAALAIFQDKLLLSSLEIDKFYCAFQNIDADNSDLIRSDELADFFHIEESTFVVGLCDMFNNGSGRHFMNFCEFVCSVSLH
jgi:hypothetical protein